LEQISKIVWLFFSLFLLKKTNRPIIKVDFNKKGKKAFLPSVSKQNKKPTTVHSTSRQLFDQQKPSPV